MANRANRRKIIRELQLNLDYVLETCCHNQDERFANEIRKFRALMWELYDIHAEKELIEDQKLKEENKKLMDGVRQDRLEREAGIAWAQARQEAFEDRIRAQVAVMRQSGPVSIPEGWRHLF